ncbi:MAG: efflux RND transporter periplasmic adaptor subunit [Phycisphaerales bacterium]|nr:efflux RND transporter periplasmic adaptor subunit [Phycisphaerales bacterium]
MSRPSFVNRNLIAGFVAWGTVLLALACCDARKQARVEAVLAPATVSVASARVADAPVILRTIGTAQSPAGITVRAQVGGMVADLPTPEGSNVQTGDVLARLDARPFEAALAEAEANLARSRALSDDARVLADRAREARESGAMNPREAEQNEAQARAASAQVEADEALLATARLNVAYCTITAPFPGRLGQFLVKPGSIVKANETDVVDLAQVDPIEVAFSIPEDRLAAVQAAQAAAPLRVQVDADSVPVVGEVTFIDNRVDPATGTVRLKARFDNRDRRLWPGQFLNVALTIGVEPHRVMVPESAVQPSQKGPAVFVVGADRTVTLHPVTVDRTQDGEAVITAGLNGTETVVTEGQLRLSPGSRVEVSAAGAPG